MYSLYYASLFFASIGGAYSLENSNMNGSVYESLTGSMANSSSGGYFPPESNMFNASKSFVAPDDIEPLKGNSSNKELRCRYELYCL